MENPFWEFSLAVYSAPGVAEACIEAQDRFGIDVNQLLLMAYQGALGVALSREEVAETSALVRDWHGQVVRPLRGARTLMYHSGSTESLSERRILEVNDLAFTWRRGRDSNPRYGCPYAAFRVRCIQPLCHLSEPRKTPWLSHLPVAAI